MDEKDYVNFEVAKFLKEKGFNEDCDAYYYNNELFIYSFKFLKTEKLCNNEYPAYSLYEIQEWLREKHNCYIQVTHEAYKTGVNNLVQVLFYEPNDNDCWSNKSTGVYGDNAEFDTYEDALNFGILEALKRI